MSTNEKPSHPLVAALLDLAMYSLRKVRARLLAQARGRVLEIGVGTGANFRHYRNIDSLDGIEPDPHMLKRARKRTTGLSFPVRLHADGGEVLPFDDGQFDTVVLTWVLCTIPNPRAALAEVMRVLKPGGLLLFAEHTRSRFAKAAWFQQRLTPVWRAVSGNCHLDRPGVDLIREAGFREVEVRAHGRESWTLTPQYSGRAVK